jgi:hypothetical protein
MTEEQLNELLKLPYKEFFMLCARKRYTVAQFNILHKKWLDANQSKQEKMVREVFGA